MSDRGSPAPVSEQSAEPVRRPAALHPHIAYLDGLRAVAVLSVLIRHAWGLSGSPVIPFFGLDLRPIVVMLSSGVDLFFVLSGFLLARSYLRAEQTGRPLPRFRDYWRARIRRIGPPFWIVLVLVVLLMTPTFIPEDRVFSTEGLVIFAAHIPIMQTLYLPAFGAYQVETPFWTLTIEMLFYLSLPILVRLFFGKRWIVITPILGLISLGWLYWVRNSADWLVDLQNTQLNVFPAFEQAAVRFFLSHQFPAFLVDFSAGILAALLVTSRKYRLRDNKMFQQVTSPVAGLLLFVVGTVALLVAMWTLGGLSMEYGYADPLNYMVADRGSDLTYYYLETIPFGIAYGLILAGLALGPDWLQRLFSFRVLAFLGVIGYSIYLLHMPLLFVVNRYGWIATDTDPSSHFLKLFGFGAPLIILLSYGFFRAVERPSIAWSQRGRAPVPVSVPDQDQDPVPDQGRSVESIDPDPTVTPPAGSPAPPGRAPVG